MNKFGISAPQFPIHYYPAGNGDVLHIVVQKNVRLSEIIVSENLVLLNHIRTRNISEPVDKLTDWERVQSIL
jgi:hypothetical protein